MQHDHVIRYVEFNTDGVMVKDDGREIEVAYITMELIEGGELFDYVANTGKFSEDICKFYFLQLLRGISFIHSKNLCHRDLKPENVLLNHENFDVKIVDFGFA